MDYYYDDTMMQALIGMLVFWTIICLVIAIINIIALWKVFDKAGIAGWKSLIPFYNVYCLCKITWGSGWLMFVYLVPLVNIVFGIMTQNRLAKSFGKGIGFTIGLIFLSPIFLMILGFGSAEYNELAAI